MCSARGLGPTRPSAPQPGRHQRVHRSALLRLLANAPIASARAFVSRALCRERGRAYCCSARCRCPSVRPAICRPQGRTRCSAPTAGLLCPRDRPAARRAPRQSPPRKSLWPSMSSLPGRGGRRAHPRRLTRERWPWVWAPWPQRWCYRSGWRMAQGRSPPITGHHSRPPRAMCAAEERPRGRSRP